MVRGKFILETITHQMGCVRNFCFRATDQAEWSKWTPNGKIELDVSNPEAFADAVPGEKYYVDFTKVEE